MKLFFDRPILIFIVGSVLLASLFFLLPINIFDGVIEYKDELQEMDQNTPLSLSYFIGIGYEHSEMQFVKDFYLTKTGIMMAFIIIIGFPALIAYRIYLKKNN